MVVGAGTRTPGDEGGFVFAGGIGLKNNMARPARGAHPSWGVDHGWLLNKLSQWGSGPRGNRIADYDPAAIEASLNGLVGRLFNDEDSYFPVEVQGWENIPNETSLFIGNHSGGSLPIDVVGFLTAWYRHIGLSRPLRPLIHELLLSNRFTGRYLTSRGALRATPQMAARMLDEGRDIMVFPGGDKDSYRPYRDRFRVRFCGRTGYARLALRAGVPIVPVAHSGAHETLFVINDGGRLARALNLKKLVRVEIFPLTVCVPWGVTLGGLPPHFPLPARFRYRIGAPILLPRKSEGEPTEDEVVALDNRVRTSIQTMLDEFAREDRENNGDANYIRAALNKLRRRRRSR
jgi:1-acyl-sn-glycerol-3-phosphate acyltransferase